MFTGIVTALGVIAERQPDPSGDVRLVIQSDGLDVAGIALGDSICTSGVCLTAVELGTRGFSADASNETLSCTTLGDLAVGSRVNLEPSLTLSQPLGGHLVSGHVDGVASVVSRYDDARSVRLRFRLPPGLSRYVARKGSICVDGVSLTVNDVAGDEFEVNIVPHTLEATTIGDYVAGTRVNIEVDQVARYVERLLGDRLLEDRDGER